MQAVLTTYFVIAPLPIVVEDEDEALNYGPGAIFQALSNNPSITRLLESDQIIEAPGAVPQLGTTVIEGPTGPPGDTTLTGWERVGGTLTRLINENDQVSMGVTSPAADAKVSIDAAKGGFAVGLLIVGGTISNPDTGAQSERFGRGTIATGDCSLALGYGAQALGTNSSAGGCGAISSAAFGTVWGAAATAALDSTALGAGSSASQSGTAVGRSAAATGLRSITVGSASTNVAADAVLIGPNGNAAADQTVVVGGMGSGSGAGAIAVGYQAVASAIDSSAWGRAALASHADSHAFGAGAQTTGTQQVIFGSDANPLRYFYFGKGEAALTAQEARLSSTRVSTTQIDEAGSNLVLVAGPGTGAGAPSRIFFQTGPVEPPGNTQHVLATQMIVGEGVDITNWLNVGPTSLATTVGEVATTDGTAILHWKPSGPQVDIGAEGTVTVLRGIDATTGGVAGGSLDLLSGTGLTTGNGGTTRVLGGNSGASGVGGLVALIGGTGATAGGPVEITGGSAVGAVGGALTFRGGPGAPAGSALFQGGLTNGVGGQSGDATLSGGDASATTIALAGHAIVKGGNGLSNNNHGGHAFIRGGLADGAGVHGRVQIETSGVGRWQVDNAGQILAVTDNTYDIGASSTGRPRDLFVARNAVIDGNLTVNGTTTTVDSEIQTADNYVLLNSEYTSDAAQTGGLIVNVDPFAESYPISDITSNVITVSSGNPTATLAAGNFLLIQNPANAANAGLFEVLSTTASSVTIDPTPVEVFTGTGLVDDATAQGVIVGTSIGVVRVNTAGDWQSAYGSSSGLVFTLLAGDLATVLTIGNITGGTDIVITSGDQITGGRANFGTTADATADGDLAAGFVGDNRFLYSQGAGALFSIFGNGETTAQRYATAVVDFSVSGTATGLIPAGALPISVVTRVLTDISGGGATGYEVGDGLDPDRWGSIASLTAGTTTDPTLYTDNTLSFNASASAGDVVLTGLGGTPTAGTVRVTLAYMSYTAPTS